MAGCKRCAPLKRRKGDVGKKKRKEKGKGGKNGDKTRFFVFVLFCFYKSTRMFF